MDSTIATNQQDNRDGTNVMWFVFVVMCVVFVVILFLAVFVFTEPELSENEIEGDSGGGSGGQGRATGGGGSTLYKKDTASSTTQTSRLTPPVLSPLQTVTLRQSTFQPTRVFMPTSVTGVRVATPSSQVRTPPKSTPTVTVAMTNPIVITARPSPTGTTTTQLPLPPGSLLCTVRRGFKRTTYTFPPDGLCTIITFDSLYDTGQTLAPPYKEDFQYFIETSKQYKVSEFGIGIKQDTCSDMKSMSAIVQNPATKQHLDELWNRYRIYHYGQVSGTMGFRRLVASVSVGLAGRGLGMLSRLMNNKKSLRRPSYTIIHYWLVNAANALYVGEKLYEVHVDIFVVVIHYAGPDINFVNCHMVPPTVLTADLVDEVGNITYYQVRMGVGITNLASNYHHWPSSTMCAVSLDMGGRWYEPCDPPGFDTPPLEYKLGKKCGYSCMKQKVLKDTQITEIARACTRPAFNTSFYTDSTFEALVTYNVQRELVFTYDGPINLRKKLCRAKVNATNVQYTFVAVNIDMEDGNGTCGYGPFPRLNMLKNLAEFFALNYTSAAKVSECMRVSYKPKRSG